MYHIEDKTAAIKAVQRLLDINQTGFYDSATKAAVSEIQSEFALEEKETVDYETFKAILTKHQHRKRGTLHSDYLYSPKFPYKQNDIDHNVELINKAILPILKEYEYEGTFPRDSFLGMNTLNAVNFLREIFGMAKSDEIDAEFVNRLMLERRALELKRKYGNK